MTDRYARDNKYLTKRPQEAADFDPVDLCQGCGDAFDAEDVNVEAFEVFGRMLCPECAAQMFEDAAP